MDIIKEYADVYLKEDRVNQPKEYFKFVVERAAAGLKRHQEPSVLDIGCAAGDFLHYLSRVLPNAKLAGMDVVPELLAKARDNVKGLETFQADITDSKTLPREKYDAVFMLGVSGFFDDYRPWLENLLKLTAEGGRAYVFGIFNPENIDVIVKTKRPGESDWQGGWNMYSRQSIGDFLRSKGMSYQFVDWTIGIDIEKNALDPVRSWTIKLGDGTRAIVNGMQILHPFALLEIG